MSMNLYEILGLDKNVSPEDIRKAYKRRALQTHPDRLPPNVTPADKSNAEEQFRLVNNAYEVLNDPQNRELYDKYGVWPPPSVTLDPPRHRSTTSEQWRPDPNASFSPFGFGSQRPAFGFTGSHPRFAFTDPFELFDSLLGDMRGHFDDSPFPNHFPMRSMFDAPFGRSASFGSPFESMFGGPLFSQPTDINMLPGVSSYNSVSQAMGGNGRWVSQSKMTRNINGRTETIHKRRDPEGNEHITYSSPEGERYTINGVEQPPRADHAIRSATAPATIQNGGAPQVISAGPQPQANYYAPQRPQPIPVYAPPPPQPVPAYSPPQANRGAYSYPADPRMSVGQSRAPPAPVIPAPAPRASYDDRPEKHHSYLHHDGSEHSHHSNEPYRDASRHTSREYRDEGRHSQRYHDDDRRSRAPGTSYGHEVPAPVYPGDREREREPRQEKDEKKSRGGW